MAINAIVKQTHIGIGSSISAICGANALANPENILQIPRIWEVKYDGNSVVVYIKTWL
jgi:hypothetical protein